LIGEVRFGIEATNEVCHEYCTKFKQNPVLKPGDARKLELINLSGIIMLQ